VSTADGFIGSTASISNSVLITGAGSLWDVNNNVFYAGYAGQAGFLTISNGGRLVTYQMRIGAFAASTNNLTVVTGAGSILQNSGTVYVGANGTTLAAASFSCVTTAPSKPRLGRRHGRSGRSATSAASTNSLPPRRPSRPTPPERS